MIIQFGHSREYDYKKELYNPIKENIDKKYQIIFPHDDGPWINSRDMLQKSDIFFAEVSYPSTGLGIELGFAKNYGTKIVCFSKEGTKISGSLKYICDDFFEYNNIEDMIEQIEKRLD